MSYPASPGYAKGSATSREAAATLYDREGLQFGVLESLYPYPQGLVVDRVKGIMERVKGRTFDRSTIAARFTELEANGMIRQTEQRGVSDRGKSATIYTLTIKGRDCCLNN